MTERSFFREAVRIGTVFKSKQGTLEHVLERTFDLSRLVKKDRAYLTSEILKLSIGDLSDCIGSQIDRENWIKTMPRLNLLRRDVSDEINHIFDNARLTPAQVAAAQRLVLQPYVTEEDVGAVIGLFDTLAAKQALVKAFLPTISL